jgi:SAM-dependent methyltransferase
VEREHACIVEMFVTELDRSAERGPMLDLACGAGRNGLYLIANRVPVVFADADTTALAQVRSALSDPVYKNTRALADFWPVDFERGQASPMGQRRFGGIIVFRYLYRPLIEHIRQAVLPGGMVIYETFTVDQPQFGRPKNPDYLLRHGELPGYFDDWNILYRFEGVQEGPEGGNPQAISRIVALKPD